MDTHTRARARAHTHTHIYIYIYIYIYAHTHTHVHTHTHTHTLTTNTSINMDVTLTFCHNTLHYECLWRQCMTLLDTSPLVSHYDHVPVCLSILGYLTNHRPENWIFSERKFYLASCWFCCNNPITRSFLLYKCWMNTQSYSSIYIYIYIYILSTHTHRGICADRCVEVHGFCMLLFNYIYM